MSFAEKKDNGSPQKSAHQRKAFRLFKIFQHVNR